VEKKTIKCALLSSFTLDALPAQVDRRIAESQAACEWWVCPYNQYHQQILDLGSDLFLFQPRIVFVAVAIEDMLTGLPSAWNAPAKRQEAALRRLEEIIGLIRQLSERLPEAVIWVHSFMPLAPSPNAILGAKSSTGIRRLCAEGNRALFQLSDELPNIHVLPLDDVFAQRPAANLTDARFYYLAKMRLGRDAVDDLAQACARRVLAFCGVRKKCIVLDLDNTLWGGILGEDGIENLQLADDGPGKAFYDMQSALLEFYETGTLLAICSKNDEAQALKAIAEHPGMILRPEHFAAMRINWEDKASNLHNLASELNIGMDTMVFLDDSPFERAEVRRLAPFVTVPDMPTDASRYPAFVSSLPYFDALTATDDDRRRGAMYTHERQRKEFKHKAESLEDFLRGLDIRVDVAPADTLELSRLAQLSQRTNQFNLTTRRYSESEVAAFHRNESWRLYYLRAQDRFGDSGISGAAFVELQLSENRARLDSFFVSCRVLGRGIESAFLAGVIQELAAEGVRELLAEYLPTEKNRVAKDFLAAQKFEKLADNLWRYDITGAQPLCPAWISLTVLKPFAEK
jgi:FkbH-like protein